MFLRTELQFRKLVLATLLLIGGVESNPGPSVTRKLKCGSCFKLLGKSTKTKPIIWCTICGWIHFVCSGLQSIEAYNKDTFTCTKCSTNRVISNELTSNPDFRKIQKRYTDPTYASAFGSAANLAGSTGLLLKQSKIIFKLIQRTRNTKWRETSFLDLEFNHIVSTRSGQWTWLTCSLLPRLIMEYDIC